MGTAKSTSLRVRLDIQGSLFYLDRNAVGRVVTSHSGEEGVPVLLIGRALSDHHSRLLICIQGALLLLILVRAGRWVDQRKRHQIGVGLID